MILGSVLSYILALSEFNITTHNAKLQDSRRRLLYRAHPCHNHPTFSIDNNYHSIYVAQLCHSQNALQLRMIIIQNVPRETAKMSQNDSGLIKLIKKVSC